MFENLKPKQVEIISSCFSKLKFQQKKVFKLLFLLAFLGSCFHVEDTVLHDDIDAIDASDVHDAIDASDVHDAIDASDVHDAIDASDVHDVIDDFCNEEIAIREAIGLIDEVSDGSAMAETVNGVTILNMDASTGGPQNMQTSPYLYYDFETHQMLQLTDAQALENTDWDIAVKRSVIRVNGGDSGSGNSLVARLEPMNWDDVENEPPDSNLYSTDEFMTETCELITVGRGVISTAFGEWYYTASSGGIDVVENVIYSVYSGPPYHYVYKFQILEWDSGHYVFKYTPWS